MVATEGQVPTEESAVVPTEEQVATGHSNEKALQRLDQRTTLLKRRLKELGDEKIVLQDSSKKFKADRKIAKVTFTKSKKEIELMLTTQQNTYTECTKVVSGMAVVREQLAQHVVDTKTLRLAAEKATNEHKQQQVETDNAHTVKEQASSAAASSRHSLGAVLMDVAEPIVQTQQTLLSLRQKVAEAFPTCIDTSDEFENQLGCYKRTVESHKDLHDQVVRHMQTCTVEFETLQKVSKVAESCNSDLAKLATIKKRTIAAVEDAERAEGHMQQTLSSANARIKSITATFHSNAEKLAMLEQAGTTALKQCHECEALLGEIAKNLNKNSSEQTGVTNTERNVQTEIQGIRIQHLNNMFKLSHV